MPEYKPTSEYVPVPTRVIDAVNDPEALGLWVYLWRAQHDHTLNINSVPDDLGLTIFEFMRLFRKLQNLHLADLDWTRITVFDNPY